MLVMVMVVDLVKLQRPLDALDLMTLGKVQEGTKDGDPLAPLTPLNQISILARYTPCAPTNLSP